MNLFNAQQHVMLSSLFFFGFFFMGGRIQIYVISLRFMLYFIWGETFRNNSRFFALFIWCGLEEAKLNANQIKKESLYVLQTCLAVEWRAVQTKGIPLCGKMTSLFVFCFENIWSLYLTCDSGVLKFAHYFCFRRKCVVDFL